MIMTMMMMQHEQQQRTQPEHGLHQLSIQVMQHQHQQHQRQLQPSHQPAATTAADILNNSSGQNQIITLTSTTIGNRPTATTTVQQHRSPPTACRYPRSTATQNTTTPTQQQTKNLKQCITGCNNTPLYRRLFNYIREAWTGVRSALDQEEEIEPTPRYRPDSLESLRRATRFTDGELKAIYRGFKAECPTGIFREETFKLIYSQFFPQGANTNNYAHYLFNTLNPDNSGCVSFEEFIHVLSILSRGSLDEKLQWAFSLYDINGDGYITKDELTDIVTAIYDLMGNFAQPSVDEETVKQRVDLIFQKLDVNKDGVVTLDEFLESCKKDEKISSSLNVFDTAI